MRRTNFHNWKSSRITLIAVTAIVTAAGTQFVGSWAPQIAKTIYRQAVEQPFLLVHVKSKDLGIRSAYIEVVELIERNTEGSAETDDDGVAKIPIQRGHFLVNVTIKAGPYVHRCSRTIQVNALPFVLELDRDGDFSISLIEDRNFTNLQSDSDFFVHSSVADVQNQAATFDISAHPNVINTSDGRTSERINNIKTLWSQYFSLSAPSFQNFWADILQDNIVALGSEDATFLNLLTRLENLLVNQSVPNNSHDAYRAAVELERKIWGTQKIFDFVEPKIIASMDQADKGKWGKIRQSGFEVLLSGQVNREIWGDDELLRAQSAILHWQKFVELKISNLVLNGVFKGDDEEWWELLFLEYTRNLPPLAALWGYIVIGSLPSDEFDRFDIGRAKELWPRVVQNAIEEGWAKLPETLANNNLGTFPEFDAALAGEASFEREFFAETARILMEAVEDSGPLPEHGFRYYVKDIGIWSDNEAIDYFRSEQVSLSVDTFCPK